MRNTARRAESRTRVLSPMPRVEYQSSGVKKPVRGRRRVIALISVLAPMGAGCWGEEVKLDFTGSPPASTPATKIKGKTASQPLDTSPNP